eukprot:TRINITY_DN15851_c0_g2_i1.p1 TRINITY_DN15851_c0_g2~~TRINITY_DN15851_c0_g2_i1.p1  ORF type:complete len:251 (+),score=97.63 TRINITY_DN15851_c0_g2_i1:92-754(+)
MPNGNSYLSLALPDEARSALAEVAAAAAEAAAQTGAPDWGFDPVDEEDLHVTVYYAGEQLRQLSGADLCGWHQAVSDVVGGCGLSAPPALRFTGLELFPPDKMNLVVARFDCCGELREVQRRITAAHAAAQFKDPGSAPRMAALAATNSDWVPHCTLGKLRAPKGSVAAFGARVAEAAARAVRPVLRAFPAPGLTLCGAVPKQRYLDWDEALQFPDDQRG